MDGIRHIKCDCGKEFDSLCHKESKELECPDCGKMVPVPEYKGLFVKVNERKIQVHVCHCSECSGEFYVPGISTEWQPEYCPFCGIKFIRETTEDVALS